MNKIYKVVWSKAKHCYVVTSELAKRQTKGCGARSLRMATVSLGVAASLLCAGAVLPIFGESVAEAGEYRDGHKVYKGDNLKWNGSTKAVTVTADTMLNDTNHNIYAYGNISYNYGGIKLNAIADTQTLTITVEDGQIVEYYDKPITVIQQYPSAMDDYDTNKDVSGYSITINNTSDKLLYAVYGGYSKEGNVSSNSATITNGTITDSVYGGYTNGGKVSNNTVNLNGGKVGNGYDAAYGGWTVTGNAENNHVNINGGTANGSVYGGQSKSTDSASGDVTGNTVTITKGAVTGTGSPWICGGYTWGKQGGENASGKAEDNTVTISGGTLSHDTSAAMVYGGLSNGGDAIHNIVKIENTFTDKLSSVTGGEAGDANTKATKNEVTIAGGTVSGKVIGGQAAGAVKENKVTVNKITVKGDVVGGFTETGAMENNEVTINGGTVEGTVYGGRTTNGIAGGDSAEKGNKVTVDGKANLYGVYGGYSQSGAASYNTVDVKDCERTSAYGGYSYSGGEVSHNTVTMSGGDSIGLYGGENYSGAGDVTHNTAILKGGAVGLYLFGGYTNGTGKATSNKVEISGGAMTQHGYGYVLAGGRTKDGDALDNTVTISAGEIGKWSGARNDKTTLQIAGGYVNGYGGKVTGNAIDISGGTFGGAYEIDTDTGVETGELGIVVYGGYTRGTDSGIVASNNTVTISKDAVLTGAATILGGTVNLEKELDAKGSADNNTVDISGGTIGTGDKDSNIYGGLGAASASNNTVTIKGSAKLNENTNIYGGKAALYYTNYSTWETGEELTGTASNNTVNISSAVTMNHLYGGAGGTAEKNTVTISDGTVNKTVYGGYGESGAATGNTVTITGGTVNGNVWGGFSKSGDPTKNSVTISGGTFNGQGIVGGYLQNKTGYNGSANENTVTISGGTFGGNVLFVQGGYTLNADNTTNNNTINLTGTVTGLENVSFYGGGSNASNTGNELHVGGIKGGDNGVWQGKTGDTVNNKVAYVARFDKVVLHSVKWDKDVAALEATKIENVKTLDITDLKFYTDAAGTTEKSSFTEGESMSLLKSGSDISSIKLTYKGGTNETITPEGIIVKGGSGEQTEATGVNGVKLTTKGGSEKVSLPDVNTILYSFEAGKVNKITFGTFDSGKEARDLSGSKFEEGNTIDAAGLSFSNTASLLKKNDAITLVSKATGMVTSVTNGTGKPIGSDFTDDNKIQFTTEAKGDVTSTGTEVKYTVTDVTLKKVDLTNWNGTTSDMSSQTAGWTLKAGETVATGDLAKADLSDLKPGDTKTILTVGDSVKFTNDAIAGNKKWQAGGEIIDTSVNGVKIEGTTTGGGVKVDDSKANQLVYQQSKDNVTKVTLSGVPYTKDGTARAFGNAYDLTNAGIDATAFKLSNLDDVKASMKISDTMVIVDAAKAIANAKGETLQGFTVEPKPMTVDFKDEKVDGKELTFEGTHKDTLSLNDKKTQVVYKVGEKEVNKAIFTGEVAWNDSEAYYTNDTSKYKIAATNVDATALKVTGTSTTALKKGDAMTLISAEGMTATLAKDQSEANKAASKITVNYSDTASGIAFGAEATGGVKTATNAVNYEVTGVTLKSVDLGGWRGTTGVLTEGDTSNWTAEDKSVAVNNADAITVTPKETQAVVIAGSGMFANVNVVKETAFDPVTQNGVTLTGTQTNTIKTAKTAVDNDTILYEIGKKDVKKVNIGEVAWGGAALDGGEDYNYTTAAVNTESFNVTYAKPEEVAANQSMTLLQANDSLKAIVNEEKAKTYSIEPVAGVTIDAKLTGKLANSGNNVTFTATENKASALTFGKVEWTGDTPLLDHSKTLKNVSFNDAIVDTSNIDFYKEMYIEADQTTTLVSGFGGTPKEIKGSKYMVGTAFDGEGSATMENGNLVFRTKTSAGVSEQTHKAVMGVEATMGLLASGIGHLDKVLDGFGNVSNAGSDGASTSASIGGGKDRYETGSHVNINSWSAAVGVGARKETKKGTLQYGIFGEYGKGNYTMHSDVGRSDGDAHYAGGGLLAKWTNKHDVYTEASFRLGRVSDSANDLLRDGAGNAYGYDIHATYYGAHVGLGKVFNYKGGKSLDVYGKFFYTKRDGAEFDAKQHYNLDSVNSSVLRIGARYGTTDKKWNWYGGLAYEYEFDGEAKGTVNGTEIRAASIKGSSVRGEFGMRMDATKDNPWRTDISIYGYGGKHRGFGGSVNVAYTF